MIANKKHTNNSRIIQSRNANNVLFSDHDMYINIGINQVDRENTGDVIVTFDKQISLIVANWHYGNNAKKFTEYRNTKSFSKVTKINSDDNGTGNGINYQVFPGYIYISEINSIESMTVSSNGTGIQNVGVKIPVKLPNLKTYSCTIPQNPDWSFLDAMEGVVNLQFQTSTVGWSNMSSLTNSNLVSLIYSGYNTSSIDLVSVIPPSLIYLRVTQMTSQVIDIGRYFNGARLGLSFSGNQSLKQATYSGGAIFPSVMNDHPDYKIDYIFQILNLLSGLKMTPDEVSRFLVDFANQVTACNLTNKRIRFGGHTANTSYTDSTQPLFTTYASALAHITGTLGITVTFT